MKDKRRPEGVSGRLQALQDKCALSLSYVWCIPLDYIVSFEFLIYISLRFSTLELHIEPTGSSRVAAA